MEPTTQEAVLKLVPTEPTAEMLTAAAPYCRQSLTRAADIYRAMVARAPTPEPMQADLRETGVQAFERYPALASWIEKMGNSGSALSLGEWMVFVGALNAALVSAEQAAMQAKSAPVAWSPLATAPKDGSEVELFIVHRNAFVSSDPVGEGWVEVCRAHWIDHNGGGWTWNGLAGSIIGWRPVAHPSPSAPMDQGYLANPTTTAFSPPASNPDLAGLVEALERHLTRIASLNDLEGVADADVESALQHGLYECELAARDALECLHTHPALASLK